MVLDAKYEEIYALSSLGFVYITDRAYNSDSGNGAEYPERAEFCAGPTTPLPEESSQSFRSRSFPGSLGIGLNWVQDQIRAVSAQKVVLTVQQNYYWGRE